MMHWFPLAALIMAAAVLLWSFRAVGKREEPTRRSSAEDREAFPQWMEDPATLKDLECAVDALVRLMSHPMLGGPGFLSIRLPQPGEDGAVTIAAQYPNIREDLYRRIVRQELARTALLEAGVPEALLNLFPTFETDSGGVVMVSVRTAAMSSETTAAISGRTDRQTALNLLAARLGERFPALEARPFGTELLLTPVREAV